MNTLTAEYAMEELKQIAPANASLKIAEDSWYHPEREEGQRHEHDWWVSVLLPQSKDEYGMASYSVEFQMRHTSLAWLVEQCRAHFEQASAQLEEAELPSRAEEQLDRLRGRGMHGGPC